MNEFLLLHDNESEGKPAAVKKSIISSILPNVKQLNSIYQK